MENGKQQSRGSSFAETLFGPKDGCSYKSSGLFGSVFGPSSTGLGTNFKYTGSAEKEYFGTPKHSAKDCKTLRNNGGAKERNPIYQSEETAEPSYLSSSIYYGGQEVYPPTSHNNFTHHTLKKGRGDEDPNGSSASRGNWWQGSLYY